MKTKILSRLLTVTFILMVSGVFAQEQNQKIDQGISNFSKYMGSWHANVNSTTEGKTQVIDYTVVYSSIADGHGVYMEETARSPEMGTYKCGNLIGYDPFAKKLHWFSVDNMGTAHDHSFTWVTPDHFTLVHNSLRNGKKYAENIDCKLKGENACELKFVVTLDGKEVERSEGIFERVSK